MEGPAEAAGSSIMHPLDEAGASGVTEAEAVEAVAMEAEAEAVDEEAVQEEVVEEAMEEEAMEEEAVVAEAVERSSKRVRRDPDALAAEKARLDQEKKAAKEAKAAERERIAAEKKAAREQAQAAKAVAKAEREAAKAAEMAQKAAARAERGAAKAASKAAAKAEGPQERKASGKRHSKPKLAAALKTLLAHLDDDDEVAPAIAATLLARGKRAKPSKASAKMKPIATIAKPAVMPSRVVVSRAGRAAKPAPRLADTAAFDGPARAWQSSPAVAKATAALEDEMFVPSYAQVGSRILAVADAGAGPKQYVAEVVAIRAKFPPLHVRFIKDVETGSTNALALPTPKEAYLHSAQVCARSD
jgi:hypothetical protein